MEIRDDFIDLDTELKSWEFLDEYASIALSKIPTTLELDIEILKINETADKKLSQSV